MKDAEKLARMATVVVEQDDQHEAARAAEREARCALLKEIVESVRPSLEVISNWFRVAGADFRGVCVTDPPEPDATGAKSGFLYLLQDGSFLLAANRHPDGHAIVTALSLSEVAGMNRTPEIVDWLADALTTQLEGKKAKRTALFEARAESLRALAVLFRAAMRVENLNEQRKGGK